MTHCNIPTVHSKVFSKNTKTIKNTKKLKNTKTVQKSKLSVHLAILVILPTTILSQQQTQWSELQNALRTHLKNPEPPKPTKTRQKMDTVEVNLAAEKQ